MITAELLQYPINETTDQAFAQWRLAFRLETERATLWTEISGRPIEPPTVAHKAIHETLSPFERSAARMGLRRVGREQNDKVVWLRTEGEGKEQKVWQEWASDMAVDS